MSGLALENIVTARGAARTVGALHEMGTKLFGAYRGHSIAVISSDPLVQVAAVAAGAHLGMAVLVLPPESYGPRTQARVSEAVQVIWSEDDETPGQGSAPDSAGLILLTSGTTGPPKLITHSYDSVDTTRGMTLDPERWICTYTAGTYAWFQVVMLALGVPGQAIVVPDVISGQDIYRAIAENGVTAVPSTPSFWRFLFATVPRPELVKLPIHRVSLGGERADQGILDALSGLYPQAKITHIFASTETGAAIVVSDGREGFPKDWLDRPIMGGKVKLKIADDNLWIKSPYSHLGESKWIDTGDEVEIVGDRVLYRGRSGERTINVGGGKVVNSVLEDHVASLRGILYTRAYPKTAPFVGNLVALDIVVDRMVWPDHDQAEDQIRASCRDKLPDWYEPRFVRFLDEVPLGPNLKSRHV